MGCLHQTSPLGVQEAMEEGEEVESFELVLKLVFVFLLSSYLPRVPSG